MKKTATKKVKPFTVKPGHVLGLRTNAPNMVSHSGFQWPKKVGSIVTAPDWDAKAECGNGLHFLKWGDGSVDLLHSPDDESTIWLIISTLEPGVVDLDGKAKCETCEIIYCGKKDGAIDILNAHAPAGTKVVYGTATAGTRGTATAGYAGTATAGYAGTATAGDAGTATAGDAGTATAGTRGTATAGTRGTATAGDEGTATAGDEGVITILYYDSAKSKYRRLIGYVGEDGLKPNVAYRINEQCQFEEVTK